MKKEFQYLKDNSFYFTTELNSIVFNSSVDCDLKFAVKVLNFADPQAILVNFSLLVKKGRDVYFDGIGNVIRSYIMKNCQLEQIPMATVYMSVETPEELIEKQFYVITHFGKPGIVANDYVINNFLTDCNIKNLLQISKSGYIDSSCFLNKDTKEFTYNLYENRSSLMASSEGSFEGDFYQVPIYPKEIGVNYMIISVKDFDSKEEVFKKYWFLNDCEGLNFVFRNSFGIAELVFIPGVVSRSNKKEGSEVIEHGELKLVDVSTEETVSIKVDNAPDWLVENAKAILNSGIVKVIDSPKDYVYRHVILKEGNVTITELSGDISDDPEKLSSFTLSFKKSEI